MPYTPHSTPKTTHWTSLLLLLLLLCASPMYAGRTDVSTPTEVKVKVIDDKTRAGIPYATLFVQELQSGSVANEDGECTLHLSSGYQYSLIVRSLGYRSVQTKVRASDSPTSIEVALSPVAYALGDVTVQRSHKDEDPAYNIMRKVMGRTPIYEKSVLSYTARTYTRGSVKLDKLPFYLRNVGSKDEGISLKDLVGKRFVLDGEVETKFRTPAHYEHHTISMRSSFPEKLTKDNRGLSSLSSMMSSIYGRFIGLGNNGSIPSPLRAEALQLYAYKLEDIDTEGDETIYQISFVDRGGAPTKGRLWISDRRWAPVRLVVQQDLAGIMVQRLEVTLNPINGLLHLPTSYALDMSLGALGVKTNFKYYSSTAYKALEISPTLRGMTQEQDKAEEALQPSSDLLTPIKGSVRRRLEKDLQTLEHRMDTLGLGLKDKYMIPTITKSIISTTDSLALSRDSLYWRQVISSPMTAEERHSYVIKDSLMQVFDKAKSSTPRAVVERNTSRLVASLLIGFNEKLGSKWRLNTDGLFTMLFNKYRYTDGAWIGPSLTLNYDNKDSISPLAFDLKPSVYYTTHNKKVYWTLKGSLAYAGMRRGLLQIQAGHHSSEIGAVRENKGLDFENSLFTLYDGRYTQMFYDKKYVKISNAIDLFNGLTLTLSGEYRQSAPLPDTHVWGLVSPSSRAWTSYLNAASHYPFEHYYTMTPHSSNTFSASLSFNTSPYYTVEGGRKKVKNAPQDLPDHSILKVSTNKDGRRELTLSLPTGSFSHQSWYRRDYAIIQLDYKRAIPRPHSLDSDYSLLRLGVSGAVQAFRYHTIGYGMVLGFYPHQRTMHADDHYYMKRANTSETDDTGLLFQTLPPYTHTSRLFGAGIVRLPLPRLLSGLWGKELQLSTESLSLKAYWDRALSHKPFLEVGYKLYLPLGIGLGVYYGGHHFAENPGAALRLDLGF